MSPPILRDATEADLSAIYDIYNREVRTGSATGDIEEVSSEEQRVWLQEHASPHCAIVAVENAEVVGWGSLSLYRSKPGYRFTTEDTIYARPDRLRRGAGRALLQELITGAKDAGFHVIVAKIADEKAASIALHTAFGFFEAGREREVGFEFDRWLDLTTMQLTLTD